MEISKETSLRVPRQSSQRKEFFECTLGVLRAYVFQLPAGAQKKEGCESHVEPRRKVEDCHQQALCCHRSFDLCMVCAGSNVDHFIITAIREEAPKGELLESHCSSVEFNCRLQTAALQLTSPRMRGSRTYQPRHGVSRKHRSMLMVLWTTHVLARFLGLERTPSVDPVMKPLCCGSYSAFAFAGNAESTRY